MTRICPVNGTSIDAVSETSPTVIVRGLSKSTLAGTPTISSRFDASPIASAAKRSVQLKVSWR